MNAKIRGMGEAGQLGDFFGRIERAAFGEIGQREDSGRRFMHEIRVHALKRGFERFRRNLAVRALQQAQFAAMCEEFRRAAFVSMNMRFVMAQHHGVRRAEDG